MPRILRIALLVVVALAIAGAAAPVAEPTHLKLIVGVTDDTAKWIVRQDTVVAVHKDLQLMAVRMTIPWRPEEVKPTRLQRIYFARIARMLRLQDRIVLAVYGSARDAPTTARERNAYCAFLHRVATQMPTIDDFEIWNEANNPTYWPEASGAAGYEALLARCWDALHVLPGRMNVISSTAPRHDAIGFITTLGDVYRTSGRTRPLFDTFGHNPYPASSGEAPSAKHPDGELLGEGDYDVLMGVLHVAFDNSAQPVPGTHGINLWYVEDGFQTVPPANKRRYYRGRENDPAALSASEQAIQLRAAILLAYCQPAVTGFFNFGLVDEDRLGGWQSGLLYRDGTRKPSYATFKTTIAEVRKKSTDCSKVAGAPGPAG